MRYFKGLSVMLFLGFVLLLAACSNDTSNNQEASGGNKDTEDSADLGTIKIGMNNWAENIAVSNMWKIILDEKGYDTELVPVEKAVLYQGLATNDLDIGMEVWLPTTDKAFYEQYEDEIELGEAWYKGTDLALTVPSYMDDINSIEDLNDNKSSFDSTIIGIEPGASITSLTEEVIKEYNLDFELQVSSEPAMLTELKEKMQNEEPVVVTLWKPHSSFANLDLKTLEDPKNVYGDSEDIYFAMRKGLEEEKPDIVKWFNNFILDDDQLGGLMSEVESAETPEEGAKKWVEENQDLIDQWIDS